MSDIKKRSGDVITNDKLVVFLYILMRDHIPCGVIESIYKEHIVLSHEYIKEFLFSNGWLAEYAKDIVNRLVDVE